MKTNRLKYSILTAFAAVALAGSASLCQAQTADVTIQSFDANANGVGINWGSSTFIWDATEGNPAGSLKVTGIFTSASDTPFMPFICYNGGNPWYNAGTFDFSLYKSIDFDIRYDPTSDLTIAQFNDLSTLNAMSTNQDGSLILQSGASLGGTGGIDIDLCGPGTGSGAVQDSPHIANTNIPAAAANGWVHMSIPIDPTMSGLAGKSGITIHKWINNKSGIQNPAQARVWIDNIVLKGTAGPPPPPKVSVPTKATPGLNVFASTAGLYDRQSAVLRQTSGLSWVGMATPANPVTYSFTIAGYPNSPDCEAYMFLIPNPTYLDGAPDWNETNCALAYIQGNSSSATMHFRYKVNEPGNQIMYGGGAPWTNAPGSWDGVTANYLESGNLGSVTNNGVLGTWTIKFTSDTNVTLIAPNGNSTNVIFPPYNVGYFAEQTSPGFYVYLGMQANNANALGQAVVYSHFAISNTASPFSEDFLADSVLDTTNTWNTSAASGPAGVLIVPASLASWVSWTLPDTGFSLEISPTLTGGALAWTSPSTGPVLSLSSTRSQLVASNEIPVGNTAFFRLIKRSFTQLQVLLPGETNAPNTLTGKTGTPTAITSGGLETVTVNAVDATWHLVNVSGDTINLTTTDGSAYTPLDSALAGGTMTGDIQFNTLGSWTVTATDTSNTNIISNTSSSLTVQ